MTIIVTKICIIIDVVGSYFYDKITTENGHFVLGGPETHPHDILWAVHDVKNHGRSEGEKFFKEFPVTAGGRGRVMQCGLRVSLVRACVRGVR
jgi:hypothetical protein